MSDETNKAEGKTYWRSLNERAGDPEFKDWVEREFPIDASVLSDPVSRRNFLSLMGASMALAGLAGCRRPVEKIIPYVIQPQEIIPGVPQYYATTMPFGLSAYGLVVESHEGRPTKIEGNELHPASRGKANSLILASILNLYDPDRSDKVLKNKAESSWNKFVAFWREQHAAFLPTKGEGLAVLSEPFSSPSRTRIKDLLLHNLPQARFEAYEPISDENAYSGIIAATGATVPLRSEYLYDKANVICALDCDFLFSESENVIAAKRFADGRRISSENDSMSRLYVIEPDITSTGAMADHRVRMPRSLVGAALAVLALKHLGEKCPVCDQDYDAEGTRRRLEVIAAAGDAIGGSAAAADLLPKLLSALASQEKDLSAAELELRAAEQSANDYEVTELAIQRRLAELDLAPSHAADRRSLVDGAATAAQHEVEGLIGAERDGEAFALRLSRAGDQATIQELQREIETTRGKLQQEDKELGRRTATGEQAQLVIEALREAASRVVTERVKEIEPLLSEVYSRIDVHPAFRVVRFLASVVRGRGELSTVVSDPISEVESDSPGTVLSSSQMNALAVCVFLSLNLGISRPPFDAVILDDPLQSLDDINLLGLVDLLRRTKDQRQLCVSTHDARFGALLARKLRPRMAQQRTIVIELDGWSRRGPMVTTRDVKSDPAPIRLLAS